MLMYRAAHKSRHFFFLWRWCMEMERARNSEVTSAAEIMMCGRGMNSPSMIFQIVLITNVDKLKNKIRASVPYWCKQFSSLARIGSACAHRLQNIYFVMNVHHVTPMIKDVWASPCNRRTWCYMNGTSRCISKIRNRQSNTALQIANFKRRKCEILNMTMLIKGGNGIIIFFLFYIWYLNLIHSMTNIVITFDGKLVSYAKAGPHILV
jgi:hypothetical protein